MKASLSIRIVLFDHRPRSKERPTTPSDNLGKESDSWPEGEQKKFLKHISSVSYVGTRHKPSPGKVIHNFCQMKSEEQHDTKVSLPEISLTINGKIHYMQSSQITPMQSSDFAPGDVALVRK